MISPKLAALLRAAAAAGASDLFLIANAPPRLRVNAVTTAIAAQAPLTAAEVDGLARSILSPAQSAAFDQRPELNFAWEEPGVGRFRVNIFRERGHTGLVARHVRETVPDLDTLGLPEPVRDLAVGSRGLVLIVGPAGAGKTTTLAALVRSRAARHAGHILTVEDPIEYLHTHDRSTIVQREVGFDTESFSEAMRNAMRQAPDAIVIGKIRDRDSMAQAINYSETGQLCLSTLHASNASQAIKRIINFFPEHQHAQLRLDLSMNLQAIVSQRLLPPAKPDDGPVLCTELMLRTAHIADLIEKGDIDLLRVAIEKNAALGMHTFDQDLMRLVQSGRITLETALEHADSRTDLSLRMRVHSAHDPQL